MIPDEIRSRRWRLPASITAGEVDDLVVDVASLVPVSTVDDETYELHRRLGRPQADDGE